MKKKTKLLQARESEEVDIYLFSYSVAPLSREVSAQYGPGTLVEGQVEPGEIKTIVLVDDLYDELMSANPSWSPSKPAGFFRDEDLLEFIEYIEPKLPGRLKAKLEAHAKEIKDLRKAEKKRRKQRRIDQLAQREARRAARKKRGREAKSVGSPTIEELSSENEI